MPRSQATKSPLRQEGFAREVSVRFAGTAVQSPPAAVARYIHVCQHGERFVGASITADTTLAINAGNPTTFTIKAGATSLTSSLGNASVAFTAGTERVFTTTSTFADTALSDGDVIQVSINPGEDVSAYNFAVTLAIQPD